MKKLILTLAFVSTSGFAGTKLDKVFEWDDQSPSDWCEMGSATCASTGGDGYIPFCSITCYHGQDAICTAGEFDNSCNVIRDNMCYCQ